MISKPSEMTGLYVYAVNWIGDAIISLAALEGIKERFPDIPITVLPSPRTSDVYRLSPAISSVLSSEDKMERRIFGSTSFTLCFPLSFRSAWNLWRLGLPNRVGYASEGRSIFLNQTLDYPKWKNKHLHQASYYRELAESVLGPLPVKLPRLSIPTDLQEKARQFLSKNRNEDSFQIAINPGAFFGSAKMWPTRYYQVLIRQILNEIPNSSVVLFSGEKDKYVTREIASAVNSPRVVSTDGQLPLKESIALLSRCQYLVSNDSGMMHIGAALGMKGMALFGPTDPVATGPLSEEIRILSHRVSCAPCFLRECPIDHRCMEFLTPETVFPILRKDILGMSSARS
ncbi:MAG: lipopolysaccharide heptosyltransferase II [Leptospirales bacterium]